MPCMNKFAAPLHWIAMTLFLVVALASCQKEKPAPKVDPGKGNAMAEPAFRKEGELEFITAGGAKHKIDIEIADTPADRSFGMMHRKRNEMNHGMLFIFEMEGPQAFWMKNTFIPLDIIYVDSQMRIVSIVENAQPLSERSLPSEGNAQYVVEVNAGFCQQNGIRPGDAISYNVAL
jgi:uncharacterized protein